MACRPKNRSSYGPCKFHPYACALKIRRLVRAEAHSVPVFADIDCEILEDSPDEPSPSWLIIETGEAYAFTVERDGLHPEEIEVQLESQGNIGTDIKQRDASQGQAAPVSAQEEAGTSGRTLLTILCYRRLDQPMVDTQLDGGWSRPGSEWTKRRLQLWKFGRRFKLPPDAYPEAATAAHENGALTVVVPRKNTCRKPLLRHPFWSSEGRAAPLATQCSRPGRGLSCQSSSQGWEGTNCGAERFEAGGCNPVLPADRLTRTIKTGAGAANVTNGQDAPSRAGQRAMEIKWINLAPRLGASCTEQVGQLRHFSAFHRAELGESCGFSPPDMMEFS